jgi:hypothetical protein
MMMSSSSRFIIKSVDLMTSFVAYLADAVNSGICRISLLTTTRRTTKVVIRRPVPAKFLAVDKLADQIVMLDPSVCVAKTSEHSFKDLDDLAALIPEEILT